MTIGTLTSPGSNVIQGLAMDSPESTPVLAGGLCSLEAVRVNATIHTLVEPPLAETRVS